MNKNIFQTARGFFKRKAETVNEAGGPAYKLSPKQALAQYAATGCLNSTFYADASEQIERVLELAAEVHPVRERHGAIITLAIARRQQEHRHQDQESEDVSHAGNPAPARDTQTRR